ncbi:MAG: hypothetical protein ACJ71R_06840 [Nitrososphaeraceae archaeon]
MQHCRLVLIFYKRTGLVVVGVDCADNNDHSFIVRKCALIIQNKEAPKRQIEPERGR